MRVNLQESEKAFEKEAHSIGKNGESPLVRRRDFLSGVLSAILAADIARPSAALCNDPPEPGKHGAAAELAGRLLGAHAESIIFESIPAAGGLDVFEIETRGDCLTLRGNNPVAQARALNHYLREYCGAHVSWTGDQLNLPARWPQVAGKVQKGSPYRYRYYLNYVTYSYTMAFWDWPRWEREIDWMALNGINLVLASVLGQERVWQNVLRHMGQTEAEISAFIPGPAFTPFLQMGNLTGWGGPLSQTLIERRVDLQVRILERVRALGIQPVLQAFHGIVPATLKDRYNRARIIDTGQWQGYQRPHLLVPGDPLFVQMAGIWYEEQRRLLGDAQYFAGDPFHEGTAADIDLKQAGTAIHAAMRKAQPGAVWVLQAWQANPRDELLAGTVKDDTLILDLYGEAEPQFKRRHGFNGHPWIWCIVNGFGGRVGLYGQWQKTATSPLEARAYGQMSGLGTVMEGITVDYPSYQLLYDMGWELEVPDLTRWAAAYARQRYGSRCADGEAAWILLKDTVYGVDSADEQGPPESIFCARPGAACKSASTWGGFQRHYDPARLVDAWRLLLRAADSLARAPTFQYDLVDVTRQVLSNLGLWQYYRMVDALAARDSGRFQQEANQFLAMILDQDRLLATQQEFLLGKWISDARGLGTLPEDKDRLEQNARTLVTVWGAELPAQSLHDYSNREWSGLLRSSYYERWKLWVDAHTAPLGGTSPEPVAWFKWEEAWTRERKTFPAAPAGDSVAEARRIAETYGALLQRSLETT